MLNFLHTLLIVLVSIGILCVVFLIAIAADLAYYHFIGFKKEKARLEQKNRTLLKCKEDDAHERGWYATNEPFLSGFDSAGQLNTNEWSLAKPRERGAHRPNRVAASLADDQIFKNTEEL